MKRNYMNVHLTKKFNKEFAEDLRFLQKKLKGGVSVYKNSLTAYRRKPKHSKSFMHLITKTGTVADE